MSWLTPLIRRFTVVLTALVLAPLESAAPASAAEPPALLWRNLQAANSMSGWDYGKPLSAEAVAGWEVKEGVFKARPPAYELLSGFVWGPGEVRGSWRVEDDGVLELVLPRAPQGESLRIMLREGSGSGAVRENERSLEPGIELAPAAQHTFHLKRDGESLTVTLDDRPAAKIKLHAAQRFGLGLKVVQGLATVSELQLAEPLDESLFNGSDLAGWWTPGNLKSWPVEDHQIVLKNDNGNYLRSERELANFTLTLEYLMPKGGNSGIGIRTPRNGWPSGDGMELQLMDTPLGPKLDGSQAMAIYRNLEPLTRADKPRQWNRVVIQCEGPIVSAWVNGVLCQHGDLRNHPELKYRHHRGWVGFQDHGNPASFRDLRLRTAPDGEGLAAWSQAHQCDGAETVLDRVLNTERLAHVDGIRSGAALLVGNKEEQLVAKVAGPGALVRLDGDNLSQIVTIRLDGQEKPAFSTTLKELRGQLPNLTEEPLPIQTWLGFTRQLEITAKGAGQLRVEYVQTPRELPISIYFDKSTAIPRGWFAPIDYRLDHHRFGVIRENDPLPRVETKPAPLAANERRELLSLSGHGVLNWFKLQADKKVLASDDLWIEVTVDGEATPALACPARYLFPGLAGGDNYRNFLETDRGGFIWRLAMPYAKGLSLGIANRGSAPIGKVGGAAGYIAGTPANLNEISKLGRLRGTYLAAGQAGPLFTATGQGRWIGLVYAEPTGGSFGVKVTLGDKVESGWGADDGRDFLALRNEKLQRRSLSGHAAGLSWRHFLLAPVDYTRGIRVEAAGSEEVKGGRLGLYYSDASIPTGK